MTDLKISGDVIAAENEKRAAAHEADFAALGEKLARSSIDIETITQKVAEFFVAVPSWAWEQAAHALRASPALANHATSLTSWKIAASSSS